MVQILRWPLLGSEISNHSLDFPRRAQTENLYPRSSRVNTFSQIYPFCCSTSETRADCLTGQGPEEWSPEGWTRIDAGSASATCSVVHFLGSCSARDSSGPRQPAATGAEWLMGRPRTPAARCATGGGPTDAACWWPPASSLPADAPCPCWRSAQIAARSTTTRRSVCGGQR